MNILARTGRIKSTIGAYHVILRGQKKVFAAEADINEFFYILKKHFDNNISELFAYSIEPKKIHLVLKSQIDINKLIKPICTSYARYINRVYSSNGKIFYDRFISEPLEDFSEITSAIIFLHNKKKCLTSYKEYSQSPDICSVTTIKRENTYDDVLNNSCVRFFLDDYNSMSDKEILSTLLDISNKKLRELTKHDKNLLIEIAVKNSNLSKN